MELDMRDEEMLAGDHGDAPRFAMRIVMAMADALDADKLIDVSSAHVDGGLWHGRASLDFAEKLASMQARVSIPTTMNVGSLDLLHPGLYRGDPHTAAEARKLMDLYVAMGCSPTWTCAPYQLAARPGRGEHIAWAESNAIVFANSVLGARTNRYGDFIDICAAITGRVPDAGFHRDENRRGEMVFSVPEDLVDDDSIYPLLGLLIGSRAGPHVPVIEGLPQTTTEDQLKALGAAAASSGSVGLFHAVGLTPEAPTLESALHGREPLERIALSADDIARAKQSLGTVADDDLDAVSIGTPHFSVSEFEQLMELLGGDRVHDDVEMYVSTGRHVLEAIDQRGWRERLEQAGVRLVVDTCTYITPILRDRGVVMTNSAKWAYYAPANLGLEVVFGTLDECVRSAIAGEVVRVGG